MAIRTPSDGHAAASATIDFRKLGHIIPKARRLEFVKGDVILKEGTSATACYLVMRGKVQITKKQSGASDGFKLATITSGEFIGEMAMLSDLPRSGTATALTKVDLLEIKRTDFQKLVASQEPLAMQLVLHFATTLAERCSNLLQLLVAGDSAPKAKPKKDIDPREVLNKVYSLWAV